MYGGKAKIMGIDENRTMDVSVYFVFKNQITHPKGVTVRKIRVKIIYLHYLLHI
jgi:hypothetical protein